MVPRATARSWHAATMAASDPASPARDSFGVIFLHGVGDKPGFRMAATQRVAFHCKPISFAAVASTALALFW